MTEARDQSGSRWFDHAFALMPPGRRVKVTWAEMPKAVEWLIPPPQSHDVSGIELAKSPLDCLLIEQAGLALNRLLAEYGQPAQAIDPDCVHLLEDGPEAERIVGGGHACTLCGRIYLIHRPDPEWNLYVLSHEMAHLAAYTVLHMYMIADPGQPGAMRLEQVTLGRSGLGCISRGGDRQFRQHFVAVNEGVTEMIAFEARKRIPNDGPLAGQIRLDDVRTLASEWAALELVVALYRDLAADRADRAALRRMILADYLTGSTDFLSQLVRRRRPALALLRDLETDNRQITAAAETLGLTDLAARLRREFAAINGDD